MLRVLRQKTDSLAPIGNVTGDDNTRRSVDLARYLATVWAARQVGKYQRPAHQTQLDTRLDLGPPKFAPAASFLGFNLGGPSILLGPAIHGLARHLAITVTAFHCS